MLSEPNLEYKSIVALPSITPNMTLWEKINTPIMCFTNKRLPLDWIAYNFYARSNQTDLINSAASYINQDNQLVHYFHTSSIIDGAYTNLIIGASERFAFNFFTSFKNRYPKAIQDLTIFPLILYTASKFLSVSAMYMVYRLPSRDFEIYILTELFMTILGMSLSNRMPALKPLTQFYMPHYKDTSSFLEFLPHTGLHFVATNLLYFISSQFSNLNTLSDIRQFSSIHLSEKAQLENGGFYLIGSAKQKVGFCDMNFKSYAENYHLVNFFEDFGRLLGRLLIDLSMFFLHKLGLIDSLKTPKISKSPLDNLRNMYFRSSARVSTFEELDTVAKKKNERDLPIFKRALEDYVDGFTEDHSLNKSDSNLTQQRKEHRKNIKDQKRKKENEPESTDPSISQKICSTKIDLSCQYKGIKRSFHLLPEYSSATSLTYAVIMPQSNNLTVQEYQLYEKNLSQKLGIAVKKLTSLNKKQKDNLSVEIQTSQDSRILGYWKSRSSAIELLSEILPHAQVRKSIIQDLDRATSEILGDSKNNKWNLMVFTHQNYGHKK